VYKRQDDTKEQNPGDSSGNRFAAQLQAGVDTVAENSGHGGYFLTNTRTLHQEDRQEEVAGLQLGLAQHGTHGCATAQPPRLVAQGEVGWNG